METKKITHPLMPLVEEAEKYLEKYLVPGGLLIGNYHFFKDGDKIKVGFTLHARTRALQFLRDLGVDIDFRTKKTIRTSNCNDLEFEAVANIEVFRKLMKFSRENCHAVVDLLPDFYMPYYQKIQKEIAFEPRTWRLIRKNVNDKRKSQKSLLPIEKRAMGLA